MGDFPSRLRDLRAARNLRQKDLAAHLGVAQTTVANYEQGARFPGEKILAAIADFFGVSLDYLLGRADSSAPYGPPLDHRPPGLMGPLARRYLDALIAGRRAEAGGLVLQALQDGTPLRSLYRDVFERTLYEVGRLWESGEIDVAAEHQVSHATQQVMSLVYRRLVDEKKPDRGTACMSLAVCGEQHEIGSRMVADFLELEGWKSVYLGGNLGYQDILLAVLDRRPDILALSATMAHNVDSAARIIRLVRDSPQLRGVGVLVGGQAFALDPGLWKKVGADGWGANADEAVAAAEAILSGRRAGA